MAAPAFSRSAVRVGLPPFTARAPRTQSRPAASLTGLPGEIFELESRSAPEGARVPMGRREHAYVHAALVTSADSARIELEELWVIWSLCAQRVSAFRLGIQTTSVATE